MSRPPGDEMIGISVEEVAFAYGDANILEKVNLTVPRGEVWALVGRSGSGKTTLLQIIAGLFRPLAGRVTVAGREGLTAGRIRGVVFQEESLLAWLSVEENMLFPCHRGASEEARAVVAGLLGAVGLEQYRSRAPSELSAGMRKRLEFARALLADSEYMLADEPFGTVDALTRRDLWTLWMQLRERSPRTGILATHDPEEAVRLCDAVVTLKSGRPGCVANLIRVPAAVRALATSADSAELSRLKERILASLAES
jgi:ABC-type nitrate/sulfonate/bicarbonate transport system ATPase subunit